MSVYGFNCGVHGFQRNETFCSVCSGFSLGSPAPVSLGMDECEECESLEQKLTSTEEKLRVATTELANVALNTDCDCKTCEENFKNIQTALARIEEGK